MTVRRSMLLTEGTEQTPFSIHCVGIGKAGADMVRYMLQKGEIEDLLEDPRARFTALAVDIGDKYLRKTRIAAKAMEQRLQEREIPLDRVQIRTFDIPVPEAEDLLATLDRYREFQKLEYPAQYWNPNYEPWISDEEEMPKPGDHIKRSMAKALYGAAYYDGDMKKEIEDFAWSVRNCKIPAHVYIFFGVGGGTGSGIALDLARHLSNMNLAHRIPVTGIAILPCQADEECHRGASLYVTLNEIDCQIDTSKNNAIMGGWGEPQRDPWTGGIFLVPQDQTYEKVRYFQSTDMSGTPRMEHREGMKLDATHCWIDAAVTNFLVEDAGRTFFKAARGTLYQGAMAKIATNERSFNIMIPFKEIAPGISVLKNKGHANVRDEVIAWMDVIPNWVDLTPGFKTDYIEACNYIPRDIYNEEIEEHLKASIKSMLWDDEESNYTINTLTPYDDTTCWTMLIIPGVSKREVKWFFPARALYDATESWDDRLSMHSWLVDVGVMLCEPSIRYQGVAGECIWGCACHVGVPLAKIRGDAEEIGSRRDLWKKLMAGTETEPTPRPAGPGEPNML